MASKRIETQDSKCQLKNKEQITGNYFKLMNKWFVITLKMKIITKNNGQNCAINDTGVSSLIEHDRCLIGSI